MSAPVDLVHLEVHLSPFVRPGWPRIAKACNTGYLFSLHATLTADPAQVTCQRCRRTYAFKRTVPA